MSFACIDFETANHHRSSACQVAVVIVSDGAVRRSASWLLKPEPFEFETICVSKHGIGPEQVADCPKFGEQWSEIREFIGESRLVAHNAGFDMSVLRQTLLTFGHPVPEREYLCTLQMSRTLWRYPSNSLPFLASTFGITLDHHDALSDATACAHILLRLMAEIGTTDSNDFVRKLPISPGILQTRWGYQTPYAHVRRQAPDAIKDFYSGRLADLEGRAVSTTGTLGRGLSRDHLKELVEAAGGEFHAGPKKNTRLFVVGNVDARTLAANQTMSAKHQKALKLFESGSGIEIISADDFLEMLILDKAADEQTPPKTVPDGTCSE